MSNSAPTPPAWTPPEGLTASATWCESIQAWRVRLEGLQHSETLYVDEESLTTEYLDGVAARYLARTEAFGEAGRAFERIWKGKGKP